MSNENQLTGTRCHKREHGWYLVKRHEAAEWEPAEYGGSDRWLIAGVDSKVLLGDDDLIINESRLLITPDGGVISITSFPMNAQVSVDVSTGDDDAFNRIFGKVIDFSVSNGEPVLIVEMTERNFQGRINQSSIAKEKLMQVIDAADDVISALAGLNEDVHPSDSGRMVELYDRLNDKVATPEVVRELARMALSSLSEVRK